LLYKGKRINRLILSLDRFEAGSHRLRDLLLYDRVGLCCPCGTVIVMVVRTDKIEIKATCCPSAVLFELVLDMPCECLAIAVAVVVPAVVFVIVMPTVVVICSGCRSLYCSILSCIVECHNVLSRIIVLCRVSSCTPLCSQSLPRCHRLSGYKGLRQVIAISPCCSLPRNIFHSRFVRHD
jgi:hypothetical protein